MDPLSTIAIVGRPNTGKSTLFNRLIGKKKAIIAKKAGTTRDRISQKWNFQGYEVNLIDTGGLEYGKKENIEADVQSQAKLAIEEATLILFVVDSIQNLTVEDFSAANLLRKTKKPVILVANKCDNSAIEENIYNIYELGLGEPIQISAIHKLGIDALENIIAKNLKELGTQKKNAQTDANDEILNICILGQPNAGKSSLVNSLIGEDKVIVSEIPGTTRDSTDTEITFNGKVYNLIDTAGIRKRGKVERGIEKFSILRCLNAIENSDIVILLIDGEKGVTKQDTHIAAMALEEEKGLILAINKIDLFESTEESKTHIFNQLRRNFSFVPWAPVIFLSAKNKKNVHELFSIANEIKASREKRIPTPELNSFMQKIVYKHLPASAKQSRPKFMYVNQVDINPPKFVFFFRNAKNLHFSYPRYIENELRKEFSFIGTPLTLKFKENVNVEKQSRNK